MSCSTVHHHGTPYDRLQYCSLLVWSTTVFAFYQSLAMLCVNGTPPSMLPEVQGPFYALDKARLFQRDYRDVDNSLIAPNELTAKLTEGTLVLVMISFLQVGEGDPKPDKKQIYHVHVDKLRILDPGNGEPSTPSVPTMPERRVPLRHRLGGVHETMQRTRHLTVSAPSRHRRRHRPAHPKKPGAGSH
ncbi:hypothetical protein B0H10DRAFT_1960296 [Mycena sp. CBHHK59/15]|nr:hypothetical protein B0H10DRAFT_1960296 [Mycena sp. CBHHK59/15]